MRSRLAIGVAIGIAVTIAILLWQLQRDESRPDATPGPGGATQKSSQPRPGLAGGSSGPHAPAVEHGSGFERVRREALARFDAEVTTRVQMCVSTEASGAAPPQPRDVRLVFEWKPELSTPDLQTLVVKEVSIIDAGGLPPVSRECIRRATGMQLTLPLAESELPDQARTFDQIVKLPVP